MFARARVAAGAVAAVAAVALLALALGMPGRALGREDPPAASIADHLDVKAVPLDGPVKKGSAELKATLVLEMRDGAYHEPKAPLTITLKGIGPVTPVRPALARADARPPAKADEKASRLEFVVPFKVSAAGDGKLEAAVSMFVCHEKECQPVDKTVVWDIHSK